MNGRAGGKCLLGESGEPERSGTLGVVMRARRVWRGVAVLVAETVWGKCTKGVCVDLTCGMLGRGSVPDA